MSFIATLDGRKVIGFSGASAGSNIHVTSSAGKLTFVLTPAPPGSPQLSEILDTGVAGFSVDTGVTLTMDAALANGKAMFGNGTVVARARLTGENLSAFVLNTDQILLADGAAYTLHASQALIARIGISGSAADLRSDNVNSRITVVAASSADVSGILLDRNDALVLGVGQNYTLTADQAMVGRVGTGVIGDFSTSGALTIKADKDADLSGLRFKASDILQLGSGEDYVLSSAQIAIARVVSGGVSGATGAFGNAGAVTVKANATTGEDLSLIRATGIDVYELAAGRAYTLTADQLSVARVGSTGATGDTRGAGVVTVNVGTVQDITKLVTKASDVLILTANAPYKLSTEQAKIAKVGALTAKSGELGAAGQITVVAGLNNLGNAASRAEDLTVFSAKGVDFYELAAGADYVLTSTQARVSSVNAGALGNLSAAGNITLMAQTGENLSQTPITGVDEFRLLAGQTYTMTAEQALKARVLPSVNGVLGNFGDVSNTRTTVLASSSSDLTTIAIDANDAFLLTANQDYTLTALQASVSRIDDGLAGSLAKAGRVVIKANAKTEDLATALSKVTGYDLIELSAGGKYSLTTAQAEAAMVIAPPWHTGSINNASGILGAADNMPNVEFAITTTSTGTVNAGIKGSVYVQYAYRGSVPEVFKATFVNQTNPHFTNWTGWESGRDITPFVTLTGNNQSSVVTVATGAGLSSAPIQMQVAGMITPWAGISLGLGQPFYSVTGNLVSAGTITLVASDAGEDLSGLTVQGIKSIQLTSGKNYTLTASQAMMAGIGAAGPLGDLTLVPTTTGGTSGTPATGGTTNTPATGGTTNTPATGGTTNTPPAAATIRTGVITIIGEASGVDFTRLKTDANDVLVLSAGNSHRLSLAQALTAKMGPDGVAGQLLGTGTLTVVADAPHNDLSRLNLDSADRIELGGGLNYTLTTAQLPSVWMGASNSLSKANLVTAVASSTGEDLTVIMTPGIDFFVLNPSANYSLRADQAMIARVGATGVPGDLSAMTGEISLRVPAATQVALDLTAIVLKDNDSLQLMSGSRYVLSAKQAAMATVVTGSNVGVRGDLTGAAHITVRPLSSETNLAELLANVRGIDRIELDPHAPYALSVGQALLAGFGRSGIAGELASKSATSNLTFRAGEETDLTALQVDSNDKLILSANKAYTLTAEQALVGQWGDQGVPGLLANPSNNLSNISVLAPKGADLTRLVLDSNDSLGLGAGQAYTLTSALVQRSYVMGTQGVLNDLSTAGAVRIVASPTGEDLTSLFVDSNDTLQLTATANYSLTASQAANAVMGSAGVKGRLTGTGVLTVHARDTQDLRSLSLDGWPVTSTGATSSPPQGLDAIQLDASRNYILTSAQANIARLGAAGDQGQLQGTGALSIWVSGAGENLTQGRFPALDANDQIILTKGKNYTLNKEQLALARVESGVMGDLTSAGRITLKSGLSGATEDLSTVSSVIGVDSVELRSGVNTTITDEQAMMAQLGIGGRIRDLRGTDIVTLKSNDQGADLSPITTDNNDLIWLSSSLNFSLNSAQVPRVTFDGQNLASLAAISGQIILKANNLGEDLSGINTAIVDVIHLSAGRNYTLTPEQAQMATLGNGLALQNTTVSFAGNGTLNGLPAGTHNYQTRVQLDTTKFVNGGVISMQVILGNGASAASYDLYKNEITTGGAQNRPINSLANAYDVAPQTTTNLTYQFQPSSTDTHVFGVEGSWLSPVSAANTFSYRVSITGNTYVSDLTKAGVVTIRANADGDNGLKSKLSFIQGLDVIALADAKDYTLSASQALLARVGSNTTSAVLTSTGVITVNDSDSAVGSSVNLTRLVLDNADVLTLGRGNYDLNSFQAQKAASSLGTAGTVNLWASSTGEDLFGISGAHLDNVYLAASRDYTLSLDQVTKSRVGVSGPAGDLTKAGKITLKLRDGDSTTPLSSNAAVKGVDIIQAIALDSSNANTGIQFTLTGGLSKQLQVAMADGSTLLTFLKNTSSSSAGGGNTGSDNAVNDRGEWTFVNNTDVLTFWNGSTAQTITLVGVSSVSANDSTLLNIVS